MHRRPKGIRHLRLIKGDENGIDGRLLEAENHQDSETIEVLMPMRIALDLIKRTHDDPELRDTPLMLTAAVRRPEDDGLVSLRFKGNADDLGVVVDVAAELRSKQGSTPRSRPEEARPTRLDATNAHLDRYRVICQHDLECLGRAGERMARSREFLRATRALVSQPY